MKINSSSSVRKVLKPVSGFEVDGDERNNTIAITGTEVSEETAENNIALKALELKDEGCSFAEAGDFPAALNSWHRGLELDPNSYVIYELRAQAYLALEKNLLAMQSAEKAVELNPNWGIGYQTLARCQREAGEVCLSVKNYQLAARLLPYNEEISEELIEVTALSVQLHQMRLERLQALQGTDVNSPSHEANTCIYHLSARATGLIDNSNTTNNDDSSRMSTN